MKEQERRAQERSCGLARAFTKEERESLERHYKTHVTPFIRELDKWMSESMRILYGVVVH